MTKPTLADFLTKDGKWTLRPGAPPEIQKEFQIAYAEWEIRKRELDPIEMLQHANLFYRVAQQIISKNFLDDKESRWYIPHAVNIAFSCEIFLKAIMVYLNPQKPKYKEIKEPRNQHNLERLFNCLDDSIKADICQRAGYSDDISEFQKNLNTISLSFDDCRYIYEPYNKDGSIKDTTIYTSFLEYFSYAVKSKTEQLILNKSEE